MPLPDLPAPARTRAFALTLAALLVVPLAACDFSDEGGPRIDTAAAGDDAGAPPADEDDVYAIHTENDVIKLGLTDEAVYMRFSDEQLRKIEEEIAAESGGDGEEGGLAGAIRSAVTSAVSKGLRTRISYEHRNVRDVRWEEGRLVVELENGEFGFRDMEVSDQDVTRQFDEGEVREFVERWREVTAGDRPAPESGEAAPAGEADAGTGGV